MGAQIRRMNAGDIAAIQEVARTTWARTYRGIIPEDAQEAFLSRAYSAESLKRRIEQGIFFAAEQNGRIVGFANFVKTPESGNDTVELAAIYVLPERQGQGVGTGLLTAGIRAVPGVSKVMVRVNRDNQAGRRFYEARGFRFNRDLVETFLGMSSTWWKWCFKFPDKQSETITWETIYFLMQLRKWIHYLYPLIILAVIKIFCHDRSATKGFGAANHERIPK